jgi:hypothetical protein
MRMRSGRLAKVLALACGVIAASALPVAAQAPGPCAAPQALTAARQLSAAQASYERLLDVDEPPPCAGKGLASVLERQAEARKKLAFARDQEVRERPLRARGLYQDALMIDASLTEATEAVERLRPKPQPESDDDTLHDVGDDIGAWAERRASDLGNLLKAVGVVLGALALGLALLALVGAVLLRISPIKRFVRRRAWKVRRSSLFAAAWLKRRAYGLGRWLFKPFAWATATPLQVEELTGGKADSGKAATQALKGFLPAVTARRDAGVTFVTTPFAAKTALEEVTDLLSSLPQGKVAAAMLKIGRRILPRDTLHVSGSVVTSTERGPGLALSLGDTRGTSVASTVLWAADFDPYLAPDTKKDSDEERMLRLTLVAAVWAEFTALRHHGVLKDNKEWRRHLGTREWMSYAFLQVATIERKHRDELVTQAGYVRALDRDPRNVHALVNLAQVDVLREDFAQARRRFAEVLARLDAREGNRDLLDRDPVRYQAAYGAAIATIENDDPERIRKARDELRPYVVQLERSIEKLGEGAPRDAADLRALLCRFEGPTLVLWAYMDARIEMHERSLEEPDESRGALPTPADESLKRKQLIRRLEEDELRHGTLVRNFVLKHVEVGARTQYNLASYYTATENRGKARDALESALELGTLTETAADDRQLAPLRKADKKKFDKLLDIYRSAKPTGLGELAAIGPELEQKLKARSINDADALFERINTDEGRVQLATSLEIGPSLVERWFYLLQMQKVLDAEFRHLNMLDAAEVDSVEALAQLRPKQLQELLEGVAKPEDIPPTSTLRRWIKAARDPDS